MSKTLTLLRRHAVAFAALFLLLASSAYAVADHVTASRAPKKIHACVADGSRTLSLTTANGRCPAGRQKISWNAAGARGPAGAAGKAGAVGPAGAAGAAGPKGDTGAAGPKGADGAAGPAGAEGDDGDTGAAGPAGPQGDPGPEGPAGPSATPQYAEFFALMPPDNAATVAPGTDVAFPQDGPATAGIQRTGSSSFDLQAIGTYRVAFDVPVTEAGQLILTLNGSDLAYTVAGRATGTSQISGEAFVQSTVADSILTVRNPAGNSTALTITPLAGGTRPVAATLTIEQLSAGS